MERKRTEIEKRLIGNGYRLTKKVYGGNKSQKTLLYYYEKGNQYVKLDYKREKVLGVGISNYSVQELTRLEIESAMITIRNIEDDLKYDSEEMVKTEPTKGTFEEMDELAKENEWYV